MGKDGISTEISFKTMKRYSKITPQGSRDYLFEECDDRRKVEHELSVLFKENNYRKVITPAIEYFDVFKSDNVGIESEMMFKMSDSKGRTTVLRPDNTMPIARMVATRLHNEELPVRLYYSQPVFVRAKDLAGRFIKNFAKYEGNAAGKALVAAGPQL